MLKLSITKIKGLNRDPFKNVVFTENQRLDLLIYFNIFPHNLNALACFQARMHTHLFQTQVLSSTRLVCLQVCLKLFFIITL